MNDQQLTKKKLLLLSNVYTPYRIPVFKEIAKIFDLKVIWVQKSVKWNPWKFSLEDPGFEFKTRLGNLLTFLKDLDNYKVVVFGGYAPTKLLMLLTLVKLKGKKVVLWYGLKNNEVYPDGFLRILKKKIVHRLPDVFVTYGSYISDYIMNRFNVNGKNIVTATNVGQVSYFRSLMHKGKKCTGSVKKRQINLLTVSRLVKHKGITLLIEALSDINEDFNLVIAGTGPEMPKIKKTIVSSGIERRVKIAGFVSREELAGYYQNSDIFILPTLTDPFSISSSEAISSGLFSLISRYDNASFDLIQKGINGFVFDPLNKTEFRSVLIKAFELYRSGKIDKEEVSSSIIYFSEQLYASKVIEAISRVS